MRPLNYLLAVVSVVAAIILVFSRRMEQLRWLAIVGVTWAVAVGLGQVVPQIVQQTVVEPNELQREAPYIANNIALTRTGFALDGVESRSISGQGEPSASALQADSPVLRNVRLWDYRIARQTFQQLRSFVPYYVFNDVDVDRYSGRGRGATGSGLGSRARYRRTARKCPDMDESTSLVHARLWGSHQSDQ